MLVVDSVSVLADMSDRIFNPDHPDDFLRGCNWCYLVNYANLTAEFVDKYFHYMENYVHDLVLYQPILGKTAKRNWHLFEKYVLSLMRYQVPDSDYEFLGIDNDNVHVEYRINYSRKPIMVNKMGDYSYDRTVTSYEGLKTIISMMTKSSENDVDEFFQKLENCRKAYEEYTTYNNIIKIKRNLERG